MNYTTLIGAKTDEGSIKYFVRHTEVPSEYILLRAQEAIYAQLRVREMRKKSDSSISAAASTITIPTDCMFPLSLHRLREYSGRIHIFDEEHYESRTGTQSDGTLYEGTPTFCTFDATTFYLDVIADQIYYYRLWYIYRPANLGVSNTTNFLTDRYSHILEAMCKHYAYAHREDDGNANKWLKVATSYISEANRAFDSWWQAVRMEADWSSNT